MVFRLITDVDEIKQCQKRLEDEMKQKGQQFSCHYATRGFSPGGMRDAYYLHDFGIYWRPGGPGKHNRYKNFFGQGKPSTRFKDAVQLNIPLEGVDRKIKGGFVKSGAT